MYSPGLRDLYRAQLQLCRGNDPTPVALATAVGGIRRLKARLQKPLSAWLKPRPDTKHLAEYA